MAVSITLGSCMHQVLDFSRVSVSVLDKELDWLRPVYNLAQLPCMPAQPWPHGIHFNIDALRSSRIDGAWLRGFEQGFDLGLVKVPSFPLQPPDNYSSLIGYEDIVEKKLAEDFNSGVLECVLEETPHHEFTNPSCLHLFHPLGYHGR